MRDLKAGARTAKMTCIEALLMTLVKKGLPLLYWPFIVNVSIFVTGYNSIKSLGSAKIV